ncbi:MAG: hypothetical protein MJ245_02480 [Clostridia bacterium]|nr:hypothetical protein [Clostridia bacterium]
MKTFYIKHDDCVYELYVSRFGNPKKVVAVYSDGTAKDLGTGNFFQYVFEARSNLYLYSQILDSLNKSARKNAFVEYNVNKYDAYYDSAVYCARFYLDGRISIKKNYRFASDDVEMKEMFNSFFYIARSNKAIPEINYLEKIESEYMANK